jgi:hypothetical protein
MRFLISQWLEIDSFFRATIKPAYQRRIGVHSRPFFGYYVVVSLRKGVVKPEAGISSKQRFSPLAQLGDAGILLPLSFPVSLLLLGLSVSSS